MRDAPTPHLQTRELQDGQQLCLAFCPTAIAPTALWVKKAPHESRQRTEAVSHRAQDDIIHNVQQKDIAHAIYEQQRKDHAHYAVCAGCAAGAKCCRQPILWVVWGSQWQGSAACCAQQQQQQQQQQ
jgi:hypothetical protein